jgi:hypothetical protein
MRVKKNKMRVKRILPKVSICKRCGNRRRVTLVEEIIVGNQAAHDIQKAFKAKNQAASHIQKWFRAHTKRRAAAAASRLGKRSSERSNDSTKQTRRRRQCAAADAPGRVQDAMTRLAPQLMERKRDMALTRKRLGIISDMITHTTAPNTTNPEEEK